MATSTSTGDRPSLSPALEDSTKGVTDCSFFLFSTCKKGESCPFRHNEAARLSGRDCHFWLRGICKAGKGCAYRHQLQEGQKLLPPPVKDRTSVPCFYFNQGYCARGDSCSFAHVRPAAAIEEGLVGSISNAVTSIPQKVEGKVQVMSDAYQGRGNVWIANAPLSALEQREADGGTVLREESSPGFDVITGASERDARNIRSEESNHLTRKREEESQEDHMKLRNGHQNYQQRSAQAGEEVKVVKSQDGLLEAKVAEGAERADNGTSEEKNSEGLSADENVTPKVSSERLNGTARIPSLATGFAAFSGPRSLAEIQAGKKEHKAVALIAPPVQTLPKEAKGEQGKVAIVEMGVSHAKETSNAFENKGVSHKVIAGQKLSERRIAGGSDPLVETLGPPVNLLQRQTHMKPLGGGSTTTFEAPRPLTELLQKKRKAVDGDSEHVAKESKLIVEERLVNNENIAIVDVDEVGGIDHGTEMGMEETSRVHIGGRRRDAVEKSEQSDKNWEGTRIEAEVEHREEENLLDTEVFDAEGEYDNEGDAMEDPLADIEGLIEVEDEDLAKKFDHYFR